MQTTDYVTDQKAEKRFSHAGVPVIANLNKVSDKQTNQHFEFRMAAESAVEAPAEVPSVKSKPDPLIRRFLRWLYPDQRKTGRSQLPDLIAYLGGVRTSEIYEVVDISPTGFYMVTHERWEAGTEMPLTLQKSDSDVERITLLSTVVRNGGDGVAFAFALSKEERDDVSSERSVWAGHKDLRKFLVAINILPGEQVDANPLSTGSSSEERLESENFPMGRSARVATNP
jgi:hypothetical protein